MSRWVERRDSNGLTEYDYAEGLSVVAISAECFGLKPKLCNIECALELLDRFFNRLCKKANVDSDQLIKIFLQKRGYELKPKPTNLGYGTSLPLNVYKEMDEMIRQGISSKVIADSLGVHRNTVYNRRKKLSRF